MEKETKAKFLTKTVDVEGNSVEFLLENGLRLKALLTDYTPQIVTRLALHGLSQKIGDAAANCSKDKAYGAAFALMTAVQEGLKAGKWGAERGEGSQGRLIEDLITAIAKIKKMDAEIVAGAVRAADEGTVKAWLKNVKIDAEIKEIRAKRAKAAAKEADEDFDFEV